MASPSPALGDKVVRPQPGTGFDLLIYSMYEKPGWQPRKAGDQIRAAHPGSAIDFEGQLYEVIDVGPGEGAAHAYRYSLRRWNESHVVRRIFPYTAETQRAEAAEVLQRRVQHRRHTWLVWLFPITGLFPSQLLQQWRQEWGLPMYGAAIGSAITVGLPSLGLFTWALRAEPPHTVLAGILLYVGLEQFIRFFWTLWTGIPRGSLVLTVAWSVLHPGKARRLAYDFSERDEVRYLRDQPWDIEIRSLFRDPALCGDALVSVDGVTCRPLGYVVGGEGLYRRYSFRLQRVEGEKAVREYQRYRTPDQRAALVDYENARSRVNSLELLYGFLPAKRQLELEKRYDFLAGRATTYSAILMLGGTALKFITLALGDTFDYSFAVAAYLAAESIYRIAVGRSRAEPVGSLFGWVLSPFLKG